MTDKIVQPFRSLDFYARQIVEGFIAGMHKSPFHGFSVEFAEHRIYNPGQNTKNIDWRLFAKTDNLYVKRYEEETNLRVYLLLDSSSSMFYPISSVSKYEFACKATAVITYLLKKQRDAFGLIAFDSEITWQSQIRSSNTHYREIISYLDSKINQKKQNCQTNIIRTLHLIAESIKRRSLVILFSDMFDIQSDPQLVFDALNHLKFNKHEIILFRLSIGSKENEFDYEPGLYKFIDSETGEEIKIETEDVRNEYRIKIKEFNTKISNLAMKYGIELVDADIEKGFSQIILPFLLKRQKMN
jgi:uncharacterized protein (DUF58 family)